MTEEKCSCICCGEVMYNLAHDFGSKGYQPSGGVAFKSYGHYGSTEFDPMDGSWVELVVCDDCFKFLMKCDVFHTEFSEQCLEEMDDV